MRKLCLEGPYGYVETEDLQAVKNSQHGNEKGVYIWAIPVEKGYMITYVGITGRSFAKRTEEHVQGYLSGEYGAYKVEYLKQGSDERVYPGTGRDADIEEFIQNHETIFSAVKEYLYQTEIFLIPLDGDKRFRKNLEAAIAASVRNSEETGDLPLPGSPKGDYEPEKNSELIKLDTGENFIGVPDELVI